MWNPMLDMVCYLSMLLLFEVAPTHRTRSMMAFSTTSKHPKGKMYNKKMHFVKKNSHWTQFSPQNSWNLQTYFDASSPQKLSDMRAGILIYHNHRQE